MSSENVGPVFSPGSYIKKFLDERGWSQVDLAIVMGRPIQVINEIILDKRGISAETARGLAQAFGTTVDVWLNIDTAYQVSKLDQPSPDVALRAKVYSKGPITEMVRRKWISGSKDATELADQVCSFLEMDNIDCEPDFSFYAARQGTSYSEKPSRAQIAWLRRASRLARELTLKGAFNDESFDIAVARLKDAAANPEGVALIPEILSEAGIRLVVVEHLPQTRIDGACFWLDDDAPVIALSLRYERIDYLWHTLLHEMGHVKARDGLGNNRGQTDTDLPGSHTPSNIEKPDFELAASAFAADTLVPQTALQAFISLNRPLYSRRKILDFARQLRIHPGILVGQLQYRGEILYSHSRNLLVSVRDILTANARTDGWTQAKRSTS